MSDLRVRVVVTGVREDGRSVIVSDDHQVISGPYPAYPGYLIGRLWPHPGVDAPAGPANFIAFQFPPDSEVLPRLQELRPLGDAGSLSLDADSFGMHQNKSTDYIVVMSGEIWLRVDDDVEAHLRPGDVVVQGGARHAWRNHGTEPCLMLGVIVRQQ